MIRYLGAIVIPIAVVIAFLAMYRQPFAPILWEPQDGAREANNQAVTFKWRYGGQVLQSPFYYRRATHFAVCVQEYTSLDEMKCEYQSSVSPSYHYVAPIADFPSTSAAPGSSTWGEVIRFFTHTVDQLPPDLRDKELMWTAAACSSSTRCSRAIPPHRLQLVSPVNLVMAAVQDDLIGGNPKFTANVKNEGPEDAVGVKVRFQTGEVRLVSGSADKDFANAGPNDRLLTKRGEILPAATYTGTQSEIKGILTANAQTPVLELDTVPSTLGVNEIGVAEGIIPLSSFSLPASMESIRIMWVAIADPDDDVPEINEDDNFGDDGIPYTSP